MQTEQTHFPGIPPPIDYDAVGGIAGKVIQGTDGNVILGEFIPALASTFYGLTVTILPTEGDIRFDGVVGNPVTIPLKDLMPSRGFSSLLADWYSLFLADRSKDAVARRIQFQHGIETADADATIVTFINGAYPPKANDTVSTFAVHQKYNFEGNYNQIAHWMNTEVKRNGPEALKGKVAVLLHTQFDEEIIPWINTFTDIATTPSQCAGGLGSIVGTYYHALRAFLKVYAGLESKSLYNCQARNLPTIEGLIIFTRTFTGVTNITLRQMAELQ